MNNTAEFNHIDFVIVENQVLDKTSIRNDFRKYYERFTINNHIDISDIERYVESSKKDYIVFFFEGIMFDFVTEYELFYNIQEEINSEGLGEWIVKGNIIDNYESMLCHSPRIHEKVHGSDHRNPSKEHKYFSMYPLMLILDTKKVQSLEIKNYGRDGDRVNIDLVNIETSSEMMHDNYTPRWIKKSEQEFKRSDVNGQFGWNLINVCLSNNFTIRNISKKFRSKYHFTYPDNNIEVYKKTFELYQNQEVDMKLLTALDQIKKFATDKPVFSLFNSEELLASNFDSVDLTEIDCIIVPCQGFKDVVYGCNNWSDHKSNIKFIHYDIDEKIVKDRKFFIEHWDGSLDNIKSIIMEHLWPTTRLSKEHQYKSPDSFKNLIEHTIEEFCDKTDYNNLKVFFNNFIDTWESYKQQKHYYLHANLFNDSEILTSLIKAIQAKNVLFLISDTFPWRTNYITTGNINLNITLNKILENMSNNCNSLIYEGIPPDGVEVKLYEYS